MGRVTGKSYLLPGLFSDEARQPFVNSALAPADLHVKRFGQHVHKVLLADIGESHHLLPGQFGHAEVAEVNHVDPVVYVAGQEHDVSDVHEQKYEQVNECGFVHDVWLFLG